MNSYPTPLLQSSWLSQEAQIELINLQQKNSEDFFLLDEQYQSWANTLKPTAIWVSNLAASGCLETFKCIHQQFNIGLNGENTIKTLGTKNPIEEQTPLIAAIKGQPFSTHHHLSLIDWLLNQGAKTTILGIDIMSFLNHHCKTPYAYSVLHAGVKNAPALDLLFKYGVDIQMGLQTDPNLGNLQPNSIFSCWMEIATTSGVHGKKQAMAALQILWKNGIDFNQPVIGPRFPDCKQNLLCHMWSHYSFNQFLPDVLSWGVDPHQMGEDGYSLYTQVLENSMKGTTKLKNRAKKFLSYLNTHYPVPSLSSFPLKSRV